LETGDVIHSVNGVPIQNLETLRSGLDKIKPGANVAPQVEGDSQLQFVEFEMQQGRPLHFFTADYERVIVALQPYIRMALTSHNAEN
jgi:hypothetical protein